MACGPGKIGNWFVPDKLLGLDMSDACKQHDEDYDNPQGRSKKAIDKLFFFRMFLHANTWKKKLVARFYYWVVTKDYIAWWKARWRDK